jgi:hypothetical protein
MYFNEGSLRSRTVYFFKQLLRFGSSPRVGSTSDPDENGHGEGDVETEQCGLDSPHFGSSPVGSAHLTREFTQGGSLAAGSICLAGMPDGPRLHWAWDLVGTLVFVSSIFICFHMLLIKLSIVYYACLFSPYGNWTWLEYVRFFGFVNQLSGISLGAEVEMIRVLLFKFGGEKSHWSSDAIEACNVYLQYLAFQLVSQIGRARGIVVLWTMGSNELQQLFQGHARAQCQEAARKNCKQMYEHLTDKATLKRMRNTLIQDFNKTMAAFDETVLKLPESAKLEFCDTTQRKAIGELRCAAKIQEFIWEFEKDLCGYGSKKKTPKRETLPDRFLS